MTLIGRTWGRVLAAAGLVTALLPGTAAACATCFGDPKSEMVKGAKAGVIVMAVVAYGVLLTMLGVVGSWTRRARRLARTMPDATNGDRNLP